MDNLEKFIAANHQEFDREQPSGNHLQKMQRKLGLSKFRRRKNFLLRYAAVSIILLSVTGIVILWQQSQNFLPKEIMETHSYYSRLISLKLDSLKKQKAVNDCQIQTIRNQLKNTKIPEKDLLISFAENPDNDFVIDAIIRQYKLQSQIIDNIVTHKYFCKNEKLINN